MAPYNLLMLAVMVSSYLVIAARIVGRNKPMEDTKALHVTKRQSSSICLLFYLDEPPDFLKCNPQNNSMLRLRCKFLVGDGSPDNPPIPFSMGWFFSSDGRVADLVNANPFTISPLTAYESVLVVLNALPGAYFCSTGNNNLILDSNVLRVDNKTLRQVCLPQEAPVLQTPPPRCIQPGIPTPRVIPFPTTKIVVTDTIDFGGGVQIPTPTYSIKLERNILVESTVLTMTMTATPQVILKVNNITGAGVGLGVGITLAVVVIPLLIILSVICLIKRKKNNKKITRAGKHVLVHPPPNKPPPVLKKKTKKPIPTPSMKRQSYNYMQSLKRARFHYLMSILYPRQPHLDIRVILSQ